MSSSIYQEITDAIIAALEAGASGKFKLPWQKCGMSHVSADGRYYRGINTLLLSLAESERGFSVPVWGTYNTWVARGAQVRRGEKGTRVVFWKQITRRAESQEGENQDEAAAGRAGMYARAFTVFNHDQVENAPPVQRPAPLVPDFKTATVVSAALDALGVKYREQGDRACYIPSRDEIHMPGRTQFTSAEAFHAVLLHEMVHSTGAQHRLNRDLKNRFGSEAYAMEELVAEIGAAMACAMFGISATMRDDHVPYIANWLRVLHDNNRAVISCAAQAQRAVDLISQAAGIHVPVQEQTATQGEAA